MQDGCAHGRYPFVVFHHGRGQHQRPVTEAENALPHEHNRELVTRTSPGNTKRWRRSEMIEDLILKNRNDVSLPRPCTILLPVIPHFFYILRETSCAGGR